MSIIMLPVKIVLGVVKFILFLPLKVVKFAIGIVKPI